jgi:hypothetical protein
VNGELLQRSLCMVDRASRYIRVMKTNLMHCLTSVYFVNEPLYISGISVAHQQEVCCIYITTGAYCAEKELFKITKSYLHIIIMCKTYCRYLHLLKAYFGELNEFLRK